MRARDLALTALAALATPVPSSHRARVELVHRALRLDDAALAQVPALHVAAELPTLVTVDAPLAEDGVLLVDVTSAFFPPRQTPHSAVLVPRRDLRPGEVFALTLLLADGTALPFLVREADGAVDMQVDVEVALTRRAAQSPEALEGQLAAARDDLEACRADSARSAVAALARRLAALDPRSPDAQLVARHQVGYRDRQDGMWMEARQAYRLFDVAYLVVTLRNRASADWVLDRAEVKAHGDGREVPLPVVAQAADPEELEPDQEGRVVVAFKPGAERRVDLVLHDRGGRKLELKGLEP